VKLKNESIGKIFDLNRKTWPWVHRRGRLVEWKLNPTTKD
jgi:hypothetical protein